jgi:hypothetical protein
MDINGTGGLGKEAKVEKLLKTIYKSSHFPDIFIRKEQ